MDNQVNQPYGTQTQQTENKCSNCGAILAPGQAFCATCGTAAPAPAPTMPKANVCNKCGSEIQDGAVFCPTCGNNVSAATSTPEINAFNQQVAKKATNPNLKKIIIGAAVAVVAIVLAIVLIPMMIVTTEELLAEGNYIEAYEKADSSSEKEEIADANLVAYISQMCVDALKDSKSFELRDAWVNHGEEDTCQIVLKVAANNSYGNTVINYWFYSYDSETKEYELWDSYSDLSEEQYYSWQDSDEQLEIMLNNMIKERISEIMSDSSLKLGSASVENINTLFENGILDDVDLLDINK